MQVRRAAIAVVVATIAIVAASGCSREQAEKRQATPLDLSTTGKLSGDVRFAGTPPASSTVDVSSAAECRSQHQGPVSAEDVLVKDGKVRNAVVYIKEGLGDRVFAASETPVVIDQKGCLFEPRIAAAQTDQPVRFLNSDPLPHNVHGLPKKVSGWNFSLGLKGAARNITIDQPEHFIELKCDIHPWMKAWLGVFDHPYFAVTDANGHYEMPNVPPGTYVVEAWHERLGTISGNVTVAAKDAKTVDLTFRGSRG